jgi:hypothetical protein
VTLQQLRDHVDGLIAQHGGDKVVYVDQDSEWKPLAAIEPIEARKHPDPDSDHVDNGGQWVKGMRYFYTRKPHTYKAEWIETILGIF